MKGIDIRITILLPLFMSQAAYYADAAVLDPAVYLYPRPPLSPSSNGIEEKELWSRTSRSTKFEHFTGSTSDSKISTATSTTADEEPMESAETFWPKFYSIDHALKPIHIPVTFSLSGSYGGYQGGLVPGVINNAYASLGTSLFGYGKSALAGSGYGNGPVRVYSGNNGPTWSGWGNGKWGHYGKG